MESHRNPLPAPTPAPPPTAKPKLLEVNLLRRYAPHWLVQDDGSAVENNNDMTQVLEPGIMKLHHEDAVIALGAQVALPTRATYKE